MMAAPALPQAQTGLAAILATLGPATPAPTETGGFEQLLAKLPGGGASGTEAMPSDPVSTTSVSSAPVSGNLAPANPGSIAPVPAAPASAGHVAAETTFEMTPMLPSATPAPVLAPRFAPPGAASTHISEGHAADAAILPEAAAEQPFTPTAKSADATPAPDAAAAASLLIAVATPRTAAPAAKPANDEPGKIAGKAPKEADAKAGAIDLGAAAVPDAPEAPTVVVDPAQAAAVAVAAAVAPTPAGKPAKTAGTEEAAPRKTAATIALPETARPADKPAKTALPAPAGKPAADPAPLRPTADNGASMAVLFGQPAAQGVAAADAAKAAAPVTERLLDMGSDDQWIAQLAADIAATKSDTGDLSFRLMPRHLGRLDVAMKMDDSGGVSLKLDAQHEATATIVTAAQPRLVEDLRQQGVRVAEAQVTHTPAETGRQQQQQGQGGRNAAPDASHLIETAPERPGADRNERAADRRGRFA